MNDNKAYGYEEAFGDFGYQKQEFVDGELSDVEEDTLDISGFDDSAFDSEE